MPRTSVSSTHDRLAGYTLGQRIYLEDRGPLANSEFRLNNFDASPFIPAAIVASSNTSYAPDKRVFFNLQDPALQPGLFPRIKSIRMHDYRAGNNTAAIRHRYNGVLTNAVSAADHANGLSGRLRTWTFPVSQRLVAAVPLDVINPSQNTTDQATGLGASWIESITPGTATTSNGTAVSLDGFNAELRFELTDYTLWAVGNGTATDIADPSNTLDVSGGIPSNWEQQ